MLGDGGGQGRPSTMPHPPGGYLYRARELGWPPTPELVPAMEEGRSCPADGVER